MQSDSTTARKVAQAIRAQLAGARGRPAQHPHGLRATLTVALTLALVSAFSVTASATPGSDTSGIGGLRPADIASAYGLSGGVVGSTVAVVIPFDNPSLEADLGVYRATWGLSSCTTANGCFRKVSQRGGSDLPAADSGWGLESALDIDAVSAACPNCHILVVEADSAMIADLGAAENTAVQLGASAVSNSWTGPENRGAASIAAAYFTHPGVPLLAATGDTGYQNAAIPATLPGVIAVGGTTLARSAASPAAVLHGDTDTPLTVENGEAAPAAALSQVDLDQLAVAQATATVTAAQNALPARTADVTAARAAARSATATRAIAAAAVSSAKRVSTAAHLAARTAATRATAARHTKTTALARLRTARSHSAKATVRRLTTAAHHATSRSTAAVRLAASTASAARTADTRMQRSAAALRRALSLVASTGAALDDALDALDAANDALDAATDALADARATLQADQDQTVSMPTPTPSPTTTPTPTTTPAPVATPDPTNDPTPTSTAGTSARGWTETAWSDGGSGCSASFGRPSWQPANACGSQRSVADVAAVGDPNTGLAVYDSYGTSGDGGPWLMAGGTSLSTPLVAAMIVRSGHAADYSNAAPLYANASSFTDVTSGSTGSCGSDSRCTAGVGYDGPTGVGTPTSLASF